MKGKVFFIGFLALLLILVAGYLSWTNWLVATSNYITVQEGDYLETVLATGRVTGEEVIALTFSRSGNITEVPVEEGEKVEKGQILAQLENQGEKNLISREENALEQTELRIRRLQTRDYSQAQEQLTQALAQEEIARLTYQKAQENQAVQLEEVLKQSEIQAQSARDFYGRSKELFQEGMISVTDMEEAEKNLELAESSLAQAQGDYEGRVLDLEQLEKQIEVASSNVKLARSTLDSLSGEELKAAQLEKERAEILLEEARLAYEDTYLKAPLEGYVNRLFATPGAYAQVGQEMITFIPRAVVNYVEVQVDEDLTGRVQRGQEALVTANPFPDREFPAVVSRVSPGIDGDRGTFKVRLALEEYWEELVPDLAVFAEIIIGEQENSIVLQESYLYREEGLSFVYTVEEDRVIIREVLEKSLGGGLALIEEGLEEGDIVLTSLDLKEGERVRLAGEEEQG